MKFFFTFIATLVISLVSGCAQTRNEPGGYLSQNTSRIGGACEGCEAIYESSLPLEQLSWEATLPGYSEGGPKLEISGIVYERDGRTPAKDVVLYVYHTNQQGRYPTRGTEKGWGKRHGYLRAWVKTKGDGSYKFNTLKPASYPQSAIPAHIHIIVKEPGINEYWIDDFVFSEDPFLTSGEKAKQRDYGGSGILTLEQNGEMLIGKRNIILGLNVPGYPLDRDKQLSSGLPPGSNCPAFEPVHLAGVDKGSKACPMCKYGFGQGAMVWWNSNDIAGFLKLMKKLEERVAPMGTSKTKVFGIYLKCEGGNFEKTKEDLQQRLEKANMQNVAVMLIPPHLIAETIASYNLNCDTSIKNTIVLYKKRKVVKNFVNFDINKHDVSLLMDKLM